MYCVYEGNVPVFTTNSLIAAELWVNDDYRYEIKVWENEE
jgi:hypothetical protein